MTGKTLLAARGESAMRGGGGARFPLDRHEGGLLGFRVSKNHLMSRYFAARLFRRMRPLCIFQPMLVGSVFETNLLCSRVCPYLLSVLQRFVLGGMSARQNQ